MIDPKVLEELSARVSRLLAATPAADVEKNLRALLVSAFSRLDLATRDDLELQKEQLLRAQQRIAALEARIEALESRGDCQ